MAEVGFLGVGSMGSALVRRLLETGHTVAVWNRTAEATDGLIAAGARPVSDAREALNAEVSISMLADDLAAESVLTPENLDGASGNVHINMASISPAAADRLAAVLRASDIGYVAAPVLGRPSLAESGTLNILAAGSPDDIARALPYLETLGVRVWNFGDLPGRANVVKLAVNLNVIHMMQALSESIAMVESWDVQGGVFVELLTSSLFGGIAYTGYGKAIAERSYLPQGFSPALGLKDLGLAEQIALDGGISLASVEVLRSVFTEASTDPELRDLDWAAVAEIARRNRP